MPHAGSRSTPASVAAGVSTSPGFEGRPRASSSEPAATFPVRIWRGDAGGRFEHYEVPRHASQTVLDVVTHVQRHVDPSLAYRYACRVGMCGSCAMTVNGRARWTCRTHVDQVIENETLEIAPLRNLPVVKDLVTDMTAFFDKWARARGQFRPTATRSDDFARVAPDSKERQEVDAGIECIVAQLFNELVVALLAESLRPL